MHRLTSILFALSFFTPSFAAQNSSSSVVSIPYELTYSLPDGFRGNLADSFVNGTKTSNKTINALFRAASKTPFISYSDEFLSLLGDNPKLNLVASKPGTAFAYEAGVWVPEQKEIWFSGSPLAPQRIISVLNLETGHVGALNSTPSIINTSGGTYFNGSVYFTSYRSNTTYRGGIIQIDPATHKATTLLNSYFGIQFDGIDDLVWVTRNGKNYLFFTNLDFESVYSFYENIKPGPMPNGVWRWDPQEENLQYVISKTDIPLPNGIHASPDGRTLYVTDFGIQAKSVGFVKNFVNYAASTPFIYAYTLDDNVMPTNRQVFGFVRDGAGDGIHVDDKGRVWTAEYSGITVRAPNGKVLGEFNSQAFLDEAIPVANFALAGDVLVILAVDQIYTVKLAEVVVSANSTEVD